MELTAVQVQPPHAPAAPCVWLHLPLTASLGEDRALPHFRDRDVEEVKKLNHLLRAT